MTSILKNNIIYDVCDLRKTMILPNDIRKHKYVVGRKQTIRLLQRNEAREVFVASDASEHFTGDIISMCKEKDVGLSFVPTMKELGELADVNVKSVAVAIID